MTTANSRVASAAAQIQMIQFIEMLVVPGDASRYTSPRICRNISLTSVSLPRAVPLVGAERVRLTHGAGGRLRQAVDHIRECNPDQSRDRDDDDISPPQHGEILSRGPASKEA